MWAEARSIPVSVASATVEQAMMTDTEPETEPFKSRFQEPEGIDSRAYIGWFLLITPEEDERALWWDGVSWKTSPKGMRYLGPVKAPIKLVREHERQT